MNITPTTIGKRLEIARESRGYSQGELTKLTFFSQSQISKFESGEKEISPLDLETLAQVLDYPKNFFYKKISDLDVHLDFRKGKGVSAKTRRRILAIVNRTRYEVKNLLDQIDLDPVVIPDKIISEKPIEAAKEIRKMWKIQDGPILDLISKIENQSIITLPMKFANEDKFSACAIDVDSRQPLIIYNSNHPFDRIRFSVAHEIGHIFLHHHGETEFKDFSIPFEFREKDREDQANTFASEFLMPENEMKKELNGLTIEKLQRLKFKWRVSMAALLERAYRLNIIEYNKYLNFRKEFSSRRWLTNEPSEIPTEDPSLIKEILTVLQDEFGYSIHDISSNLGLYPREFNSIYLGKVALRSVISN
ncbi:XRE family transcriptional regulator [Leptospira sp. 96542]|nr:XRE family transcriptional regulator [Leptospira sp. 96542]